MAKDLEKQEVNLDFELTGLGDIPNLNDAREVNRNPQLKATFNKSKVIHPVAYIKEATINHNISKKGYYKGLDTYTLNITLEGFSKKGELPPQLKETFFTIDPTSEYAKTSTSKLLGVLSDIFKVYFKISATDIDKIEIDANNDFKTALVELDNKSSDKDIKFIIDGKLNQGKKKEALALSYYYKFKQYSKVINELVTKKATEEPKKYAWHVTCSQSKDGSKNYYQLTFAPIVQIVIEGLNPTFKYEGKYKPEERGGNISGLIPQAPPPPSNFSNINMEDDEF